MSVGAIIRDEAFRLQLNPDLIAAVIQHESGGNPWAIRHEPDFARQYLDGKSETDLRGFWPEDSAHKRQERLLRCFSMGLMQIMVQTAREHGFDEYYATALLDPKTNINLGCKILQNNLGLTGDTTKALLKYNGGRDKSYPQKVLKLIDSGQAHYLLRV